MTDIISVETTDFNGSQIQSVTATVLYDFLGLSKGQFSRWCKKNILKNEFAFEGTDWVGFDIMSSSNNGKIVRDYHLTIDFAKRLSMMARTEKGEEARLYFLKIEKVLQQIAKPKSTLEMLKEAVQEIETKEKQVLLLEKTVSKQNETNAQLFEMTAMASKTGIRVIKEDLGAEINAIIYTLYGEMFPGDYKSPHIHARNLYEQQTGIIYWGAKITSMQGKRDYLRWLQKQKGGENILQGE